ncbi:hypothetical protein COO60DRAFT_846059 [Scenedesmus sp. NREL 46B-D3]|nr:hypothetical protein COO60DRAFT_846059 [Scenedesmus sp. NREL 46B-D3]
MGNACCCEPAGSASTSSTASATRQLSHCVIILLSATLAGFHSAIALWSTLLCACVVSCAGCSVRRFPRLSFQAAVACEQHCEYSKLQLLLSSIHTKNIPNECNTHRVIVTLQQPQPARTAHIRHTASPAVPESRRIGQMYGIGPRDGAYKRLCLISSWHHRQNCPYTSSVKGCRIHILQSTMQQMRHSLTCTLPCLAPMSKRVAKPTSKRVAYPITRSAAQQTGRWCHFSFTPAGQTYVNDRSCQPTQVCPKL